MRHYSPLTHAALESGARVAELGVSHAEILVEDIMTPASMLEALFSASQIARQLGMELQGFEVASSFAEVEAALVR